ncbi:hypothetical protein PAPYR_1788 [Paratrimastix pyriformis]|uniref:DUF7886 domain-containing protein n=1 Tax=Paratrimastix pyriformis TaxID=342808 RepID=A0ABQ8URA0_9EUKA|nr:hypothetical protein PAPYR_1788 [Paratrimastix pyriformis]
MDILAKDMIRIGCLQGLKYFSFYLRGREELVVTITPPPQTPTSPPPRSVSYLVTAYLRCKNPYVYPFPDGDKRSPTDAERPYKLTTTSKWKERPVRLFLILDEIFRLTCAWSRTSGPSESAPSTENEGFMATESDNVVNPFAVDRDFFLRNPYEFSASLTSRSESSATSLLVPMTSQTPEFDTSVVNAYRSGCSGRYHLFGVKARRFPSSA